MISKFLALFAVAAVGVAAENCRTPDGFIDFEFGTTKVDNGQGVHYQCKCYIAKNCPSPFDPPPFHFFWEETNCDVAPPPPFAGSCSQPESCPTPEGYHEWVAGRDQLDNGQHIHHDCRCYKVKNCPSPWERPPNMYFYEEADCKKRPPTFVEGVCTPTTTTTRRPGYYCPDTEIHPDYIPFEVMSTKVDNGQGVHWLDCKCYIARRCPSDVDAPTYDSFFWVETDCSVAPAPADEGSCDNYCESPTVPEGMTPYIYGQTVPSIGETVHHECRCYTSKKCGGPWDRPPNRTFYDRHACVEAPPAYEPGSCARNLRGSA